MGTKINQQDEQFSAALRFIIASKRMTKSEMARIAGKSIRMIDYVLSNERGLGKAAAISLSERIGYSYPDMLSLGQWIINGRDPEEFIPGRRTYQDFTGMNGAFVADTVVEYKAGTLTKVPLISWVRAGSWKGISDIFYPDEAEEWITVVSPVGQDSFALRVHGDSMSPEFNPGDIIVVQPSMIYENGSYVIAKIDTDSQNGEATFKQFVQDADRVYLKPLNRQYPVMDMNGVKFKIVGRVVQKIKVY